MKEPIKISEIGKATDKNFLAYVIASSMETLSTFKIYLTEDNDIIDLTPQFFGRYSDHSILLTIDDTNWKEDALTTNIQRVLLLGDRNPATRVNDMIGFYSNWLTNSTYRNDNPALNETFSFLFSVYKIYMNYYERLKALWSLSKDMLYTEDLDNLLNDNYVLTTGTANSSQKSASVSHPLDASDIDDGIVDVTGTGEDSSDNTSTTTNRTRNYFAQFRNLWYNWKDIKQEIVNSMSYLFVEVLDI